MPAWYDWCTLRFSCQNRNKKLNFLYCLNKWNICFRSVYDKIVIPYYYCLLKKNYILFSLIKNLSIKNIKGHILGYFPFFLMIFDQRRRSNVESYSNVYIVASIINIKILLCIGCCLIRFKLVTIHAMEQQRVTVQW